jgi:hypothetical protein
MSQAMKPRWRLVLVPLLVPLMLPLLLHGCPPIQQGRFDTEPIQRRAERRPNRRLRPRRRHRQRDCNKEPHS